MVLATVTAGGRRGCVVPPVALSSVLLPVPRVLSRMFGFGLWAVLGAGLVWLAAAWFSPASADALAAHASSSVSSSVPGTGVIKAVDPGGGGAPAGGAGGAGGSTSQPQLDAASGAPSANSYAPTGGSGGSSGATSYAPQQMNAASGAPQQAPTATPTSTGTTTPDPGQLNAASAPPQPAPTTPPAGASATPSGGATPYVPQPVNAAAPGQAPTAAPAGGVNTGTTQPDPGQINAASGTSNPNAVTPGAGTTPGGAQPDPGQVNAASGTPNPNAVTPGSGTTPGGAQPDPGQVNAASGTSNPNAVTPGSGTTPGGAQPDPSQVNAASGTPNPNTVTPNSSTGTTQQDPSQLNAASGTSNPNTATPLGTASTTGPGQGQINAASVERPRPGEELVNTATTDPNRQPDEQTGTGTHRQDRLEDPLAGVQGADGRSRVTPEPGVDNGSGGVGRVRTAGECVGEGGAGGCGSSAQPAEQKDPQDAQFQGTGTRTCRAGAGCEGAEVAGSGRRTDRTREQDTTNGSTATREDPAPGAPGPGTPPGATGASPGGTGGPNGGAATLRQVDTEQLDPQAEPVTGDQPQATDRQPQQTHGRDPPKKQEQTPPTQEAAGEPGNVTISDPTQASRARGKRPGEHAGFSASWGQDGDGNLYQINARGEPINVARVQQYDNAIAHAEDNGATRPQLNRLEQAQRDAASNHKAENTVGVPFFKGRLPGGRLVQLPGDYADDTIPGSGGVRAGAPLPGPAPGSGGDHQPLPSAPAPVPGGPSTAGNGTPGSGHTGRGGKDDTTGDLERVSDPSGGVRAVPRNDLVTGPANPGRTAAPKRGPPEPELAPAPSHPRANDAASAYRLPEPDQSGSVSPWSKKFNDWARSALPRVPDGAEEFVAANTGSGPVGSAVRSVLTADLAILRGGQQVGRRFANGAIDQVYDNVAGTGRQMLQPESVAATNTHNRWDPVLDGNFNNLARDYTTNPGQALSDDLRTVVKPTTPFGAAATGLIGTGAGNTAAGLIATGAHVGARYGPLASPVVGLTMAATGHNPTGQLIHDYTTDAPGAILEDLNAATAVFGGAKGINAVRAGKNAARSPEPTTDAPHGPATDAARQPSLPGDHDGARPTRPTEAPTNHHDDGDAVTGDEPAALGSRHAVDDTDDAGRARASHAPDTSELPQPGGPLNPLDRQATSARDEGAPAKAADNPYKLSEEDSERIFQQKIVPKLARSTEQKEPMLVIVGGQTGAGKTATTEMLLDTLNRRGNPTHINMDFYNPHHPHATQLRASDPAHADAYLRPDGDRWWAKAQDYAMQRRSDVLLESAMLDKSEFEGILAKFRDNGYRVEAALMAVPAPLSRLGILARFNHEMRTTGSGRLVETSIHDRCCEGVLRGAGAVDNGAADAVSIFRRNNIAVYSAQKPTGAAWPAPIQSREAVARERIRRWTDQESLLFSRSFNQLAEHLGPGWRETLSEIAELARPLLRPGTPLTVPQPRSWGLLRQSGR